MSVKCKICTKAVYPMDPQINLDGVKLHKPCAKCQDCGCQITTSNFTKNETQDETVLLCKIHYFKRFHEGGSYLGGEKFRVKSDRDMKPINPLRPVNSTDELIEPETVSKKVKVDVASPVPGEVPVSEPEVPAEVAGVAEVAEVAEVAGVAVEAPVSEEVLVSV
jgi:hypothetical protein